MNLQYLSGHQSRKMLESIVFCFFERIIPLRKAQLIYSRYFFDHPDISGFWSNKILDQGPLDGNPAINVYSRVVWVLAGFWIFFYSVVRPLEVPFFRLKQVFCTFWSQCSRFWYNKNVFGTDNIMQFMCLLKEIMAVSSYLVYFLYW